MCASLRVTETRGQNEGESAACGAEVRTRRPRRRAHHRPTYSTLLCYWTENERKGH